MQCHIENGPMNHQHLRTLVSKIIVNNYPLAIQIIF